MSTTSERPKANVLGIGIDAVNMPQALSHIARHLEQREKGYVCLAGVHGVMEAQRDPAVARVLAGSALTAPDGMPTVWVGRHQGYTSMERVTGPDLMIEMFEREKFHGYTHYFFGGKEGIAEELRESFRIRFPDAKIVGTFTPPFGPMPLAQEKAFIEEINRLRPDIIWVGISTPKQERFMEQYLPLLDTTLMFGVGAAFDFHTGRIADCAEWIKVCGLQWLHRLLQDPRHLWRRYLRNNPAFLFAILLQLTRFRTYPLPSQPVRKSPTEASWVETQTTR